VPTDKQEGYVYDTRRIVVPRKKDIHPPDEWSHERKMEWYDNMSVDMGRLEDWEEGGKEHLRRTVSSFSREDRELLAQGVEADQALSRSRLRAAVLFEDEDDAEYADPGEDRTALLSLIRGIEDAGE